MNNADAVRVNDLTVRYPNGRLALDGISFGVPYGECIAILGANGAGKSTLLLAVVGVLRGEGEIIIEGVQLSSKSLAQVRRTAQLVFQDPNDQLFMPVLKDDVAFGPLNFGVDRHEAPGIVEKSLTSVGLRGFEDRGPYEMSLGERKRAAIATALACDPRILLMDEPSAGLDPRGKRELAELLKSLESTKLIATHDLAFAAEICSSALVLDRGRLVAAAPTAEVLADQSLLEDCALR